MEENYTIKEVIETRFDEMGEHLKEIKLQTQKTNGRVNSLENHKAYLWGAFSVLVILGSTIIYLSAIALDSKIDTGIKNALSAYDIKVND